MTMGQRSARKSVVTALTSATNQVPSVNTRSMLDVLQPVTLETTKTVRTSRVASDRSCNNSLAISQFHFVL
ncbi:unnamed protein product [Hymenolepis diminuta]|uniref:Uncharacterized protein n=1 Tax=Hymenolepis diminuta TaxID=6216 RepID=A0A564YNR3_HYMDI|nr:unnamed protein product [Hymenolepis diminuta]